tara:strand:- start:20 stop:622 length:603 start_codon:yes stop_codon:yes gene_type:complete
MENKKNEFNLFVGSYITNLCACFTEEKKEQIFELANNLKEAWKNGNKIYICGNGGSAGNAIHIANDFIYGTGSCGNPPSMPGLRVNALPANPAILTCLANDTGFENIFSYQIDVQAEKDDILIVLSGSGNSLNIVKALEMANLKGLKTFAILAFDGGKCINIAQYPIHFEIDDMQIAEDLQLIIGHLCMQWLSLNKPKIN